MTTSFAAATRLWMPRTLPEASNFTDVALCKLRLRKALLIQDIHLEQLEFDLRFAGISVKMRALDYAQAPDHNARTAKLALRDSLEELAVLRACSRSGDADQLVALAAAVADLLEV